MEQFFKDYYKNYDDEVIDIHNKYIHSLNVQKLCLEMAKSLRLDNHDTLLAGLTGLYHDIGRFKQWTEYKTYMDHESIDHGDLSESIVRENKVIDTLEDKEDVLIAIKDHNKKFISATNKKGLLLSKIIKDADKLEIYNQFVDKIFDIEPCNNEINERAIQSFYKHELVNNEDVNNYNDHIIRLLAFVYDLHFDYSFKYLKDNNIIDKIYDLIDQKEIIKKYFDYIKKYIEEMINKC